MAISYANTTEIETISKDIISLANDLNNEINSLFSRLSNVPYGTKEWSGNQALKYFNIIASDKKQYNELASNLKDIGYKLRDNANEIRNCINKNKNNESQKGV